MISNVRAKTTLQNGLQVHLNSDRSERKIALTYFLFSIQFYVRLLFFSENITYIDNFMVLIA